VVRALPGLGDAVVVRADDPGWGQVPVVVIAAAGPAWRPPDLAQLRAAVAAALSNPARPARIVTVEAIPVLASGKPDRQALAALARDRAARG
jgi:O-succinylbenzoic acid--CoA ligase